jgi:Na+(H+)/acetate symporter ActP
MDPWQPLGTAGPGLPPMAAAFFGLPVGMLAVVLVSQITPTPSSERIEILDDIRRPTPSPIFDI